MNRLQNIFKSQPNANTANRQFTPQQKNIFMQIMFMNDEQKAQVVADVLNKQGITSKEQFENFIKNSKCQR